MMSLLGATGMGMVVGWCLGFYPPPKRWRSLIVFSLMGLTPPVTSMLAHSAAAGFATILAEYAAWRLHTAWRHNGQF